MSAKIPASVEILTRNSAATLERCLESVKDFAEIIVLDGNSTDKTREIASRYGAKIYQQYDTDQPLVRISDFSEVRNKGLKLARYEWFLYIDADEYLSREAAEEIRSIVADSSPSAHIWRQPRRYVLGGRIVECATTYPNRQIRFFHRSFVKGFVKPVHERIEVRGNQNIGTLNGFEYVPLESVAALDERWRRYAAMESEILRRVPAKKLLRVLARQCGLLGLYGFRYIRNLLFCPGFCLPFGYEWARHKYTALLIGIIAKLAIGKLFLLR
jgi:glycosyltransferase involved in cell wall biosynthesis